MSTLDRQQIAKAVRGFLDEIRPQDEKTRAKLDFIFRFHGQSVALLEIRPSLYRSGNTEHAFAKATYVKSSGVWKVYWKRGTGKWHPYEPSAVGSLEKFLSLVKKDERHCFFG